LDNIYKYLHAAGMGIQDLVKMTIYLAGEMDTIKRRQVLAKWLGNHRPCSSLVCVAAQATSDIKVEIDAWACE